MAALLEAEVEYKDKVSPSIDVRFKAADEAALLSSSISGDDKGQGDISIVIWTTTPWTLPANRAVCLRDVQTRSYSNSKCIIVAAELAKDVMERAGINYHTLGFTKVQILNFCGSNILFMILPSLLFLETTSPQSQVQVLFIRLMAMAKKTLLLVTNIT